jgi:hypothetical protein
VVGNWRELVKKVVKPEILKKSMAFGQFICDEIKESGVEVI